MCVCVCVHLCLCVFQRRPCRPSSREVRLLLQQDRHHPSVFQEDETAAVPSVRKQPTTESTRTGTHTLKEPFYSTIQV